jgi:hypothetical protein
VRDLGDQRLGVVLCDCVHVSAVRWSPGVASGVLATVAQIGNALGVAIIGLVFYAYAGSSGEADPTAYSAGFEASLGYLIAIALGDAVLSRLGAA